MLNAFDEELLKKIIWLHKDYLPGMKWANSGIDPEKHELCRTVHEKFYTKYSWLRAYPFKVPIFVDNFITFSRSKIHNF